MGCSGQHPSCAIHPWKLLLHPPLVLLFLCKPCRPGPLRAKCLISVFFQWIGSAKCPCDLVLPFHPATSGMWRGGEPRETLGAVLGSPERQGRRQPSCQPSPPLSIPLSSSACPAPMNYSGTQQLLQGAVMNNNSGYFYPELLLPCGQERWGPASSWQEGNCSHPQRLRGLGFVWTAQT